jgi:hypothetical protein
MLAREFTGPLRIVEEGGIGDGVLEFSEAGPLFFDERGVVHGGKVKFAGWAQTKTVRALQSGARTVLLEKGMEG